MKGHKIKHCQRPHTSTFNTHVLTENWSFHGSREWSA